MRMPLKARVSFIRQRFLLLLRYAFRLPIDDVRDAQRTELDRQVAEALASHFAVIARLDARLRWYEAHDSSIRKQYAAFLKHETAQAQAERERQDAFVELVAAGVDERVARERVWPKPVRKPEIVKTRKKS